MVHRKGNRSAHSILQVRIGTSPRCAPSGWMTWVTRVKCMLGDLKISHTQELIKATHPFVTWATQELSQTGCSVPLIASQQGSFRCRLSHSWGCHVGICHPSLQSYSFPLCNCIGILEGDTFKLWKYLFLIKLSIHPFIYISVCTCVSSQCMFLYSNCSQVANENLFRLTFVYQHMTCSPSLNSVLLSDTTRCLGS